MTPTEREILERLFAGADGEGWMSLDQLEAEWGRRPTWLLRSVRSLREAGLIERRGEKWAEGGREGYLLGVLERHQAETGCGPDEARVWYYSIGMTEAGARALGLS